VLLLSGGAHIGVGYLASRMAMTSRKISTKPMFRGVRFSSHDTTYFPFSPFLPNNPLFGNKLAAKDSFLWVVVTAHLATVKARMDSSPFINSVAFSINSYKLDGGLQATSRAKGF
jgi:hypothetical protein